MLLLAKVTALLLGVCMCVQIYKSTKCNDMVQTGTCPRGAFCAFAHVERTCHIFLLWCL